jgi:hypothetical protein
MTCGVPDGAKPRPLQSRLPIMRICSPPEGSEDRTNFVGRFVELRSRFRFHDRLSGLA